MTSIASFFRKTPVVRLQDYFTAAGFTSLPPVDWTKPEPEVIEPLIRAVDAMDEDERQRVILHAARVAALADEPGQNALQNVVINRAVFDTLEGAYNRSLWVFLKENDRFRLAEEVRYNDERRRGRSWSGFEVEKDRTVRKDPIAKTDAYVASSYARKKVEMLFAHLKTDPRPRSSSPPRPERRQRRVPPRGHGPEPAEARQAGPRTGVGEINPKVRRQIDRALGRLLQRNPPKWDFRCM